MTDSPSLSTTLQDVDGNYSSKRIAAFISLLCIVVGFVGDTFFGHHVSPEMLNDLMIITLGGLGMALVERFAPKS